MPENKSTRPRYKNNAIIWIPKKFIANKTGTIIPAYYLARVDRYFYDKNMYRLTILIGGLKENKPILIDKYVIENENTVCQYCGDIEDAARNIAEGLEAGKQALIDKLGLTREQALKLTAQSPLPGIAKTLGKISGRVKYGALCLTAKQVAPVLVHAAGLTASHAVPAVAKASVSTCSYVAKQVKTGTTALSNTITYAEEAWRNMQALLQQIENNISEYAKSEKKSKACNDLPPLIVLDNINLVVQNESASKKSVDAKWHSNWLSIDKQSVDATWQRIRTSIDKACSRIEFDGAVGDILGLISEIKASLQKQYNAGQIEGMTEEIVGEKIAKHLGSAYLQTNKVRKQFDREILQSTVATLFGELGAKSFIDSVNDTSKKATSFGF